MNKKKNRPKICKRKLRLARVKKSMGMSRRMTKEELATIYWNSIVKLYPDCKYVVEMLIEKFPGIDLPIVATLNVPDFIKGRLIKRLEE